MSHQESQKQLQEPSESQSQVQTQSQSQEQVQSLEQTQQQKGDARTVRNPSTVENDDEHGRAAEHPTDIPAAGWKDVRGPREG